MIRGNPKLYTGKDIVTFQKNLLIPSFQRSYTWQSEEVKGFIDDLFKYATSLPYYLGTVYAIDNELTLEIIDGQQRIITLFLLLNAYKFLDPNGFGEMKIDFIVNGKLILNSVEGSPFIEELLNSTDKSIFTELRNFDMSNLTKMQLYVNQYEIFEYLRKSYIDDLHQTSKILNNLNIIMIYTDSHKSGAQIFENINAKGVQLSNVDVIKNAFFSRIDTANGQDDFRSVKYNLWSEIEKNIYSDTLTNNNNLTPTKMKNIRKAYSRNIDTFFRSVLILLTGEAPTVKSYNLSRSLVKHIDEKKKYKDKLREIKELSDTTKFVLYPFTNSPRYSQMFYIHDCLKFISRLNIKQHIPFFISLYHKMLFERKFLSTQEIEEIQTAVFKLAIFHFLFNRVASERPSKIESVYKKMANDVYSDTITVTQIVNSVKKLVIAHRPNVVDVETKLENMLFTVKMKNNIRKEIRILDEDDYIKEFRVFDNNSEVDFVFKQLENSLGNNYSLNMVESIEHVYNRVQGRIDLMNFNNFKLHGLLPLEKSINKECDSKTIEEKIEFYRASKYKTVEKFVKIYDEDSSDWEAKWKKKLGTLLLKILD